MRRSTLAAAAGECSGTAGRSGLSPQRLPAASPLSESPSGCLRPKGDVCTRGVPGSRRHFPSRSCSSSAGSSWSPPWLAQVARPGGAWHPPTTPGLEWPLPAQLAQWLGGSSLRFGRAWVPEAHLPGTRCLDGVVDDICLPDVAWRFT